MKRKRGGDDRIDRVALRRPTGIDADDLAEPLDRKLRPGNQAVDLGTINSTVGKGAP
jgi:hypothetical protein